MNRRHFIQAIAAMSIMLAFSPRLPAAGSSAAPRPNIILIMADDLGYECIGANGCDDYKTPVLDGLAADGVRFTNCFANPLCTPSRVKIMTGMFNVRNYVKFGVMDRKQKTFAHAFKKAGYATCIAGKWQLGKEKDAPQHFGFDQSCLWQHRRGRTRQGKPHDSRFSNPRLEINGEPADYDKGEFGPDVCTDFICDFMEKHRSKPFLVYYPMILTHCPFIPTPGTPDWDPASPGSPTYKGNAKYFGDMVHHMDRVIGRITAKLDALKLRKNTLVIFTGDNGTDKPIVTSLDGKKVPGGKGRMDDTGTRVPLIVSWPGRIQAGAVSDELVDFADMLPTLCDAGGLATPDDRPMDGVSFWGTLLGRPGRKKPWSYIWYHGKVLARTRTRMVRRMKKNGPLEFIDCAVPYEEKSLSTEPLQGKEKAVHDKLLGIIRDLDRTRPVKPGKVNRSMKRGAKVKVPRITGEYVNVYKPAGDVFPGPSMGELVGGRHYDEWVPNDHCFVRDKSGRWHAFGITHPRTSLDNVHLGETLSFHAMAPKGPLKKTLKKGAWKDQPKILPPAERPGEIPANHAPYIIKRNNRYHMVYGPTPLRLAVSDDLFKWTPLGKLGNAPEGRDPNILLWNGTYHLTTCGVHDVRIATSRDFKTWKQHDPILTMKKGVDPESPSIIRFNNTFYLFVCGWNGVWDRKELQGAYQHITYVYQSDDPLRFDVNNEVTTVNAHAPEIFQDEDGDWFISSVEWPYRGVSIAPLAWE